MFFVTISFISVTLAWFAYSGFAKSGFDVDIKAWHIEFNKNGAPVSNELTIIKEELAEISAENGKKGAKKASRKQAGIPKDAKHKPPKSDGSPLHKGNAAKNQAVSNSVHRAIEATALDYLREALVKVNDKDLEKITVNSDEDYEYIEKAIELGAARIVFTDHCPFPENPFRSRMEMEQLPEYILSMRQLRNIKFQLKDYLI